ncbi:nucleotidyltransferase family protein [Chitinimonas sp.]|uniref:nucleotidyltransferase family protein n=1 Tax=Chitinimonas sp. TaxID=1934313 RepID=UPI0035B0D768
MAAQAERLRALIAATPWLMTALAAVRDLALPEAAIAAGAIRNLLWDDLHGFAHPAPQGDIDVICFDPTASLADDARWQALLQERLPHWHWEVVNQALVHHWYRDDTGQPPPANCSLAAGMARWPETATAVAARLDAQGNIALIAPFGLDDLFSLTLRRNPACASRQAFAQRVRDKQWLQRWPQLRLLDADPLAPA